MGYIARSKNMVRNRRVLGERLVKSKMIWGWLRLILPAPNVRKPCSSLYAKQYASTTSARTAGARARFQTSTSPPSHRAIEISQQTGILALLRTVWNHLTAQDRAFISRLIQWVHKSPEDVPPTFHISSCNKKRISPQDMFNSFRQWQVSMYKVSAPALTYVTHG